MTTLAPILEGYFAERLGRRGPSTRTVASYRDTFCLLLGFMKQRSGKAPANLDVGDLDAEAICAFLDHLERDRGNAISTCNARLAAVHSFFAYTSSHCPEHAATIQRVLAIPTKRRQSTIVSFLDASEIDALLASPDRATWLGEARSLPAARGGADRPAGLRADRAHPCRRRARRESWDRAMRREGAKGTAHAADQANGAGAPRLALRGRRRWTSIDCTALSEPDRRSAEQRRRGRPAREVLRSGRVAMSVAGEQARHAACFTPQLCDDAPASKG